MRKLSGLISLFCIVGILLVPFPMSKKEIGVYNSFSRTYWCATPNACVHEIGHKLDQEGGWISATPEFHRALRIFIMVEARVPDTSPLFYYILDDEDFNSTEIYADIFQWSNGKEERMPEIFRPFYDWQYARKLLGQ